jgi:sulfopyruvate decarboxylase subunit alpha
MNVDLKLYETIKNLGVNLLLILPDNMIQGLLKVIYEKNEIRQVTITREEEGMGIAAGAYLGGMTPAIIMQNSGLGNSINAIKSLLQLYKIPILLIMSHRGGEGEKISAQNQMGQVTLTLLECIDVKTFVVNSIKTIENIKKAMKFMQDNSKTTAVVLERSLWREFS